MNFDQLKLGKSVEGSVISSFRNEVKSNRYIYLMAGVHGDEVEGVYVLKQLFNWLQTDEVQLKIPLIVIPVLNVDGYRVGSRLNAHSVDLNRNLPASSWQEECRADKYNPGPKPLSEPENQFLYKLLKKYRPKLVMTFHTLRPLLNYDGILGQKVGEYLGQFNGYEVSDSVGYQTPGSLGQLLPEKFESSVLTYELPELKKSKPLEQIWLENEEGLKSLFIESEILKN